jgi:predicted transcriptional regulator
MALKKTLAAVQAQPGTAKEIAVRTNQHEAGCSVELLTLFHRGKMSRVKTLQPSGRWVFIYSVADEAASQ